MAGRELPIKSRYIPRCHALLSAVLDGRGGPDTEPLMLEVQPQEASVSLNGYHDADTWAIQFDARSLPFDPELIRSAAVVVYMFAAETVDDDREWAVPEFEMIRGLLDEDKLSISNDGKTVSLSGRDYTGILLDTEWDPRNRIPSGKPLDTTVQAIADAAAPKGTRQRFQVAYESIGNPVPPIVGAAHRSTKKKGLWVKPGKSYWDVIYEMVLHHGLITFVEGERIVITDPRTQTAVSAAAAPRVAWGRNLSSLEVTRKFAKERVPQIQLTAYDASSRKQISVTYPANPKAVTTGIGTKKNEVMFLPGPGSVQDRATLLRYAQVRYDNMARAEAVYRFETLALEALDGEDLLRLKAGSPVRIGFDPFNQEEMRTLSVAQRIEHMRALGYSPKLSAFVANYFERIEQFRQAYYTRQADYKFSTTDGLRVAVEAVNYAYEPRELAEAAA
jgi:hypothetical protein